MSYLELEGIDKSYGEIVAVHDFNISVDKGEFVSLLGPSGCGKTTTLRIIAGFEKPDVGVVRLDGEDITSIPPHQRGMGMVFQAYALFPNMTAWGNVAFGLRVSKQKADHIERRTGELLDLVGLGDSGQKYPGELSGGQQQRVALARALAIEPKVLLLDEPLSALDAVVRVSLRQEIRRIQTQLGITTVYVTHDQEEALSISDRVVVMRQAVIEQIGTPIEIYTSPKTNFVATFIGTATQFSGIVESSHAGRVKCGDLVLSVGPNLGSEFKDGDKVIVFVRPEAIHIAQPGEQIKADNMTTANLNAVTLLGPVIRLSLSSGELNLVADVNTNERSRFTRGETFLAYFSADACRVMPDDGQERSSR
jgi:putative spermidine/putrescine transport system ATP-binding protein